MPRSRHRWLLITLLAASLAVAPALAADAAYVQVTQERASRIVATLELDDAAQRRRVQDIIASQYQELNRLQAERDSAEPSKRAEVDARVVELHYAFLGRLGSELTPAQVDQVKDGLTYGVLPLTYQVYQDMVPTLTDEQKRQILAWLIEAREHAMDGGSSDEKHRWFGKYKGRINNYLSAAGVDLKQAERDMRERRQQKKQTTNDH